MRAKQQIYYVIMKKYYLYIACLAFALFFSICSQAQSAPIATAHFIGVDGKTWVEYAAVWNKLQAFYGNAMPKKITIKFIDAKGFSRFDPNRNIIFIDQQNYQELGARIIAHESSHLCLNLLTKTASTQEQFRFMDEGFAEIMAHRAFNDLDRYKFNRALPAAALQLQKNNLSFAKVQKWSEYFGDPHNGRWHAYDVGASFDFFIIDKFGERKLRELFAAIGLSHDFAAAVYSVLGVTLATLEADWKVYVAKVPLSFEKPQIKEFFPANNATNIPTDISEIIVSFSVPMNIYSFSIVTDCDGICYTNAYWKDQKRLAIRLPKQLRKNHQYSIQLGDKKQAIKSQTGIPLPITTWKFTTKSSE